SNRNHENFFINGRYIKSRTAAAALEQAYVTRIPAEKFPVCVLNIELNPAAVDVNVHPAKLEVKFSNEKLIFDAVYYAVKSPLENITLRPELRIGDRREVPIPAQTASAPDAPSPVSTPTQLQKDAFWISGDDARKLFNANRAAGDSVNVQRTQIKMETPGMMAAATPTVFPTCPVTHATEETRAPYIPVPTDEDAPPAAEVSVSVSAPPAQPAARETESLLPPREEVPDYVIIGEAYNTYIIVQLEDRLILIDKHAAHERILFDQLSAHLRGRPKNAQLLLVPLTVPMSDAQRQALADNCERIEAIGFGFSVDGENVSVTEIPTEIHKDAATDLLLTLADRLAEGTGTVESTSMTYFEAKLYQASCKAAIKGGRLYSAENIRWICDHTLQKSENGAVIRTCPHGRPVAFEIRKNSIERQFARTL
ncbi:MAG: hypothetical protein J6S41_02835, partial [Clostridia bacterium]|nr:hypothetical protein [Clostridia bacterium]